MNEQLEFLEQVGSDFWLVEDERDNLKVSYRIKEVIYAGYSTFQHVMILDSYDFGRMLVLDGVVQSTSLDGHIYNEMITHVPMMIHPNPEHVLIVGGGDCGAAREVAKYDCVKKIDMVEIDELVVEACREHLPTVSGNLSDQRVNFIFADGVEFIKTKRGCYDVIVVDSSDPIGPAMGLFEYGFYREVHHALKGDGLMVCQSQSPLFHREVMNQTVHHLERLFPIIGVYGATVPTYPGGFWSFSLGSKMYYEIPATMFDKNTKYVNDAILRSCFDLPEFLKLVPDSVGGERLPENAGHCVDSGVVRPNLAI
ncbi:polyamine aminopropyltransferase [Nocardia araoensis]|uniref:polyamine aminopropyltransferase n=1 Tax=Nocardia araoensis TaxID=228600 RepID=UPI0002DD4D6F|nr:polyamine aminopropyltransferase [Nocardia araoensis]